MKTPRPTPITFKDLAFGLFRVANSPWALRTALFFFVFMAGLLALVFKLTSDPRYLFWAAPLPLLMFSAVVAFRTLWNTKLPPLEGPQVYDKAKYHYDGDFPKGLPPQTGLSATWLPFFSTAQNPLTIFGQFLVGCLFLLWADFMVTRNRKKQENTAQPGAKAI